MKIAKNNVVTMHYTLTLDDGAEVDTSVGSEPLVFLFGAGQIIPGLEDALVGKSKGEQLKVKVEPELGYGDRDDTLTQVVPKSAFEGSDKLELGMQFHAQGDEGPIMVTVVKLDGDKVTIDGNHPLAGKNLNFDVNIVDVRDATPQELTHGHAHGAHGHDH